MENGLHFMVWCDVTRHPTILVVVEAKRSGFAWLYLSWYMGGL